MDLKYKTKTWKRNSRIKVLGRKHLHSFKWPTRRDRTHEPARSSWLRKIVDCRFPTALHGGETASLKHRTRGYRTRGWLLCLIFWSTQDPEEQIRDENLSYIQKGNLKSTAEKCFLRELKNQKLWHRIKVPKTRFQTVKEINFIAIGTAKISCIRCSKSPKIDPPKRTQ